MLGSLILSLTVHIGSSSLARRITECLLACNGNPTNHTEDTTMTATMTPDQLDLLGRALRYIEDHPEQWDQRAWGYRNDCGTSGCLAGWVIMLDDPEQQPPVYSRYQDWVINGELPGVAAAKLLGLSDEQESLLFDERNTLSMLRRGVQAVIRNGGVIKYAQLRAEMWNPAGFVYDDHFADVLAGELGLPIGPDLRTLTRMSSLGLSQDDYDLRLQMLSQEGQRIVRERVAIATAAGDWRARVAEWNGRDPF